MPVILAFLLLFVSAAPTWAAWGSLNTLGSANSKTAGASLAITTSAAAEVGNAVVVCVATDNLAATDGDQGDITSVTDSASNTYTKARQRTNSQAAAGAGASVGIYVTKVTTQIASGGTITANFNGSPTARALTAWEFTITSGAVVTIAGGVDGTPEDNTTVPSATISSLTSQEYLWVACLAAEGPTGDTYTKDADYTAMTRNGTTGNPVASNSTVNGEFRIFTGTTDTNAPTLGTARDLAQVYVALREGVPPPATLVPWIQDDRGG